MTNRFSRILDRSRQIAEALRKCPHVENEAWADQLRILVQRARLVRLTIALAPFSILLAAATFQQREISAVAKYNARGNNERDDSEAAHERQMQQANSISGDGTVRGQNHLAKRV